MFYKKESNLEKGIFLKKMGGLLAEKENSKQLWQIENTIRIWIIVQSGYRLPGSEQEIESKDDISSRALTCATEPNFHLCNIKINEWQTNIAEHWVSLKGKTTLGANSLYLTHTVGANIL